MNALPKIKETSNLKLVSCTKKEVKRVSMDNGFIQIPRELMLAIAKFGFTKHQRAVIDAVTIKVLGYHKEIDWVGNPQIVELTDIGFDCKASKAKQELIRMNVLVQKGKMIGFNYNISEWEKIDLPKQSNITQKSKKTFTETVKGDLPKQSNTKETITKNKINNTPLTPQGGSANAEQPADGSGEKSKSSKPKNLPVDYQGVMEEFNLAVADTPISQIRVMSDQRKRAVHSLAKLIKRQFGCYTRKAFGDYFRDFVDQANARLDRFYFGGLEGSRWVADFDYILRAKTFAKTVENSL